MITNAKQRSEVYDKVFTFMLRHNLQYIPTPLEKICMNLDIELIGLSCISKELNISQNEVFGIWGNENGHLIPYKDKTGTYKFKIAYNDRISHNERKNFTIAEELLHIVLEHYKNPMYDIFNPTPWNEKLYQLHEGSARIGAGILICPPPIFYEIPALMKTIYIKNFCDISLPCANTRLSVLQEYEEEIKNHPKYEILKYNYRDFIYYYPCPLCGESPVIPDYGICYSCVYGLNVYNLPSLHLTRS